MVYYAKGINTIRLSERLTQQLVRRIIKTHACAAGVEGFISEHLLRVKSAVSLARGNALLVEIQVDGRRKDYGYLHTIQARKLPRMVDSTDKVWQKEMITMDFSAWSPSHTILVAITLVTFGVQLIVILISLKIKTERLEDSVDKIDTKIDVVQSEIRKEIRDVREGLRGEIQGVRGEIINVREELRGEIRDVRTELKTEIQGVRGEIADVRTEMNQQIGSVREELSKLNQNHIEHLTRHES